KKPRSGRRSSQASLATNGPGKLGGAAAEMLAAIIQSSDAAIISKSLDGTVMSWNQSAERIFGYSASEMIGNPIHIIEPPSRPKEMAQILNRIRHGERIDHYETERMRKDGRIIQILLTVSPIHDANGRIIGATKIVHDITDRKHTEAQFEAKSEQLEEFAHALNLAPAMVRAFDGKILQWGRGLEALYGWSAEEAIGRVAHELLATEFPIPLPEILDELLSTGEWQGELVHTHRSGRRVIVASQWALHRNINGEPISIVKMDWDMTETRRVQSMVAEREARLRSIFETAPDAIITIDERGIVQTFSAAAEKLFGYAAGEVIGRNVKMLMPAPHRENHDGYLARYLRTGEKRIIGIGRQVEAQRKDGTVFPIQLAIGEAILGETHIFSGFISDLTARVKMEQELRQAQKMEAIGQLTGGVAHDFNNLLTVISGNLEMLERRVKGAEDREILREAQEASQLGADLTRRLLAFGRRQPLQPKPTDLRAMVGGVVDLLRRSLGAAIEIDTRLGEELPMILVDPGQVENALLNLAVNARDAMPKGGRLMIHTARTEIAEGHVVEYADVAPGTYVTLAVTDTGSGMTPEVRQRAFEPFYTTKAPGVGSGLGLSMVYGFVKQSGGHVQLESEPGQGTTVRLYLPALNEDAATAERHAAASRPRAAAGETVLVVEDDPRVRRVSVRRLKELGYAVIEAESGPAALAVFDRDEPIDLLFTDIAMPGDMTGVDLAGEARRRRPELKILFTSGYAEPAVLKGGLLRTNAGWIAKPYSIGQLQAKLRELLER
ncbi:MAG TPA: PAS domain S-box protein, partial [Candidatus Cybelea sp.]|nr:PAS domain S-box protein [Candidatus Cybelea sp.]